MQIVKKVPNNLQIVLNQVATDRFEASMSVTVTSGHVKDFSELQTGQIIGLHQAQICCKEISEIAVTGLQTVQRISKSSNDGEPSTILR